jgi:hypothetical protein
VPSKPRAKGTARKPSKAALEAAEGHDLPEGAALGAKPREGIWHRLLDREGKPVVVDGTQVRVP